MAKLEKKPFPGEWKKRENEDWRQFSDREQAAVTEIVNKSLTLPEGSIVGVLLQFPVGDGYAVYVVTKEKPLTVAHVPFGDAWQVPAPLVRGLNKNDILQMHHRAKELQKIFDKNTKKTAT